jgi:radical SAM protein with 4Fe4S-binding SPASM domain
MKQKIPFILHIRLTKACNAECTYCSAWQEDPRQIMSSEECSKALNFIFLLWKKLNIEVDFVSVEYVGGEVLLLPTEDIINIVENNRLLFAENNIKVLDGVQTNLIASHKKIKTLYELFDGRVGTSIDDFTDQRRINGSNEKYKVIMMTNEKKIQDTYNNRPIPAVFVIDNKSYPTSRQQIQKCIRDGRNLVLRPVFQGGLDIDLVTSKMIEGVMLQAIDDWFMRSTTILEPLYGLLKNRLQHKHDIELGQNMSFCAFISDCARRSLSLEPNGDLFVCLELADHDYGKLGNALTGEFDFDLWEKFNDRPNQLHEDCLACPYLKECRGGCMMHSIEQDMGMYGKTIYCEAWKAIFAKFDHLIEKHGVKNVEKWIERIEMKQSKVHA